MCLLVLSFIEKEKNGPENYYSFVEFCGQSAEMSTKLNMKIAKPLKNQWKLKSSYEL